MTRRGGGRTIGLAAVLGLLVFSAVVWALWPTERARRPFRELSVPSFVRDTGEEPVVHRTRGRCGDPRRACIEGDVWMADGCDHPIEKIETCSEGCAEGRCVASGRPSEDPCRGKPDLARCDGAVARGCMGGMPFSVDCGARGKRCLMGAEGAVCREVHEDDCAPGTPSRCEGEVLHQCVEGRWAEVECTDFGGSCTDQEGVARCRRAPATTVQGCGPCGCDPAAGDEVCDGRDNDGDGHVDEGVDCGVVDIVALIAKDTDGAAADEKAIEAEIEALNAIVAADPEFGLRFRLAATETLSWGYELTEPTERAFFKLATQLPGSFSRRAEFSIPVLFSRTLEGGDVPKAGVSTLPNGTCGGLRRHSGRVPVGLIALAERRSPTTLAHEVGHFLGLCHTHDETALPVDADPESQACVETCALEGDGVCATPVDPGPESCQYGSTCEVACGTEHQPDPTNVMSYYTWCRSGFTREQLKIMRKTLFLRRGWHACVSGGDCACSVSAQDCAEGMSCYPTSGDEGTCRLDGPSVPGGTCDAVDACGERSICVEESGQGHCLRPCATDRPGCTCRRTSLAFGVCREDIEVTRTDP